MCTFFYLLLFDLTLVLYRLDRCVNRPRIFTVVQHYVLKSYVEPSNGNSASGIVKIVSSPEPHWLVLLPPPAGTFSFQALLWLSLPLLLVVFPLTVSGAPSNKLDTINFSFGRPI